jgi:hypothetical protein
MVFFISSIPAFSKGCAFILPLFAGNNNEGKGKRSCSPESRSDPDDVLPKADEKSSVFRDRMDKGWSGIVQNLKKTVDEA